MAVVFELVVNFGTNQDAVSSAERALLTVPSLDLGDSEHEARGPRITWFTDAYIEFSVAVSNINKGGVDAHHLPAIQVTAIAEYLYDVLRRFARYEIAVVGWDPRWRVKSLRTFTNTWSNTALKAWMDSS